MPTSSMSAPSLTRRQWRLHEMERNDRDGELRREEDGNNFMEKVGRGRRLI